MTEFEKLVYFNDSKNQTLTEDDLILFDEVFSCDGVSVRYLKDEIDEDDDYAHLRGRDVNDLIDEYYYVSVLNGTVKNFFFEC